ncbi:hypothetical protein FBU30_006616 [Linnemannia zychae]|nr:hypothetical protein FBU30_006616 [Linnemannia zychae]
MFEEESWYQSTMDKIYKIHVHADMPNKVSPPQLAIVGDQSCGKSSVLEAMTQLPFPRSEGMCTRFAIQVNLRRNSDLNEDKLSARIEGQDTFNEHNKSKSLGDFESVIADAVGVLCKNEFDVSDKMLELTLAGPNQSPLTMVDLPGFIQVALDKHANNLPETINRINARYIQDPRTIILAVMPASIDFENSTVLSVAKKYDPDGSRTIPIVTKPDLMVNHKQWMNVILNRSKAMKLGYLVMCNKVYSEDKSWDYARKEEVEFFSTKLWNKVRADRKGRVAVKAFLGTLLYKHITKELPAFKREVRTALNILKFNLKAMGTPISDINEARSKLIRANLKLQRQVVRFLNADYDSKYIVAHKNKAIPIYNEESDEYEDKDAEENENDAGSDDDSDAGSDDGGEDSNDGDEDSNDGDDDDDGENGQKDRKTESSADIGTINFNGNSAKATVRTDGENPYFVRSSLLRSYYKYRLAMKDDIGKVSFDRTEKQVALYKGNDPPGFVSFVTFKNIYVGHYLPGWKSVTDRHVDRMHTLLSDAIREFIKYTVDGTTCKVFTRIFSRFSRTQETKIKKTVEDIFEDEETPLSLSRQFVEAIHKERSKNNQIPPLPLEQTVNERNDGIEPQLHQPNSPASPLPSSNDNLLYSSKSPLPNSDWNDMLSTKAFVPCLLAYLTAALERIVDKVVAETIERNMIRRIDEYFDMVCDMTEKDLECMIESPSQKAKRKDLETKITDIENLLDEL